MAQPKKAQKNSKNPKILLIAAPLLVVAIIATVFFAGKKPTPVSPTGGGGGETAISENGDLIIPIAEVSAKAKFYPVEVDGTKLEVIAVEAPDGTVRTAFNTCQVCFDSGRGYYKQEGDTLVCQNCGNSFTMDQVEVAAGGCNPVPIFPENKTVDETNITISKDYLKESKEIFANWKV